MYVREIKVELSLGGHDAKVRCWFRKGFLFASMGGLEYASWDATEDEVFL